MAALGLLAGAVLSGCSAPSTGNALPDLAAVFGAAGRLDANGTWRVQGPWLEARLLADGLVTDWSPAVNLTVAVPNPSSPRSYAASDAKAGVRAGLDIASTHPSVEVRLASPTPLTGYDLRLGRISYWVPGIDGSLPCEPTNGTAGYLVPAQDALRLPLQVPGLVGMRAELERAGAKVAVFCQPVLYGLGATWHATGSVQPLGASVRGTATPDYTTVSDEYVVNHGQPTLRLGKAFHYSVVNASTKFRGSWSPGQGHHIELQVAVHGVAYYCDTLLPLYSTPKAPGRLPQDPSALSERSVEYQPYVGTTAFVIVGTVPNDCSHATLYANAGPVPYTLDVRLEFRRIATP